MAAVDLLNRVKVKAMLISDRRVGGLEIGVDVHDGTAILTGDVESEEQKQIAEQLTWEVDGINEVENDIHIVPADQLYKDNDEVILPGPATTGAALGTPETMGPYLSGAAPMGWRMPVGESEMSTAILTDVVEKRIAEDGRITSKNIHVTADGTSVRLHGTVDSMEEYYLVQEAAESVAGVTDVQNDLEVEEGHSGHKCSCGRM